MATQNHAATVPKYGDASSIDISTLPVSTPEPNEFLIKVEWGGVNFIDTYQRAGVYPNPGGFPMILGNEASGEIVKLPTDESVLSDANYKSRGYQVGDKVVIRKRGAHAEYITSTFLTVDRLPSSIPTRIGAAAFTQGLTALTFLTESYAPNPGDWILVHTAAGGLGLLFTQIATAKGANVIGTTSTPEKAALAKAHGAKEMILYTKEDTVARVLEITGGQGVHAVFDGVGKDTFEANFKLLRRKGTLVSVGNASGVVPPFPPLKLTEKNLKLLRPTVFNYVATPEETDRYTTELWNMIASQKLKINVFKEYDFTKEGVRAAHEDIVSRKTTGKLLIKIA